MSILASLVAGNKYGMLGSRTGELYLPDFYDSNADGADWLPAFQRAQATVMTDVGATLVVPVGDFHLSGTFHLWRKLRITGAGMGNQPSTCPTRLIWPENMDGIRLWGNQVEAGAIAAGVPADASGGTAAIENLGIFCSSVAVATTSGIGIHCSATPHLYRVNVQDWGGDGVRIRAYGVAENSNANLWFINNCVIRSNKGWGLYVAGADANAGVAIMIFGGNNTLGDFHDESELGNTYIALHSDANRKVAYSNPNGNCVYLGCYNENAGGATDLGPGTFVLGGVLSSEFNMPMLSVSDSGGGTDATCAVISAGVGGVVTKVLPLLYGSNYTGATVVNVDLHGSGSGLVVTPNIVGGHITSYTVVNGGTGYSAGLGTGTSTLRGGGSRGGLRMYGPFESQNLYQDSNRYVTASLSYSGDQFFTARIFNNSQNDFEQFFHLMWDEGYKSYKTSGPAGRVTMRWPSAFGSNLTMGRSSAIPAGSLVLQDGFWLGGGQTGFFQTDGRYMDNGTGAPTTGQWAQGDIRWNRAPTSGGFVGWVCVTTGDFAGTPPVFKTFGLIS